MAEVRISYDRDAVTIKQANMGIDYAERLYDTSVADSNLLREIREVCSGLALSDRARAARYDKIVEILKEGHNED